MVGAASCLLCRHETNNELRLFPTAVQNHEYLHIGRWIKTQFTKDELLAKMSEFAGTTTKEKATPEAFLNYVLTQSDNFKLMCDYTRCEVMFATIRQ